MRVYALKPSLTSSSAILVELLRTLKPHQSPVVTVAVDQTSTLLATGASDGVVKVWDIRGGYMTHTFRGHSGIISSLHFFEVLSTTNGNDTGISARNKRKRNRHKSGDGGEGSTVDVMGDSDNLDQSTGPSFRLASG